MISGGFLMSLKVLAALSRAQAKFEAVKRSAENPAFKRAGKVSRYATLEDVIESVRPALTEEGLIIVQKNVFSEGLFGVATRLIHLESGEEIYSQFLAPLEKQSAQGVASILTYARRYEYFTLLGLVTPDDDGNAASGIRPQTGQNQPKQAKTPKTNTKAPSDGPKTAPAAPPVEDKAPEAPSTPETTENASNSPAEADLTVPTPAELQGFITRAKAVAAKLTNAGMVTCRWESSRWTVGELHNQ